MAKHFWGIEWTSDVIKRTVVYHGLMMGNLLFTVLAQTKIGDFYSKFFGTVAAGCFLGLILNFFMVLREDQKQVKATPSPCQEITLAGVADQPGK